MIKTKLAAADNRFPGMVLYEIDYLTDPVQEFLFQNYQYVVDEDIEDVVVMKKRINQRIPLVGLGNYFFLNRSLELNEINYYAHIVFRSWLNNDFHPIFLPTRDFFLLKKSYPSGRNDSIYYRYSIVQIFELPLPTRELLCRRIRGIYGVHLEPFVYNTLMIGSNGIDESESNNGIHLNSKKELEIYQFKKIYVPK